MARQPTPTLIFALSLAWFGTLWSAESAFLVRLAPLALVALVMSLRHDPRAWHWDTKAGLIGLAVGLVTTVLTYPLHQLVVRHAPQVSDSFAPLFERARLGSPVWDLLSAVIVVAGEEALWRNLAPVALERHGSRRFVWVLCVGIYGLSQGGSGSWVVVAASVGLGGLWSALRVMTGSAVAPLVAHLVWTLNVVVLRPLG